MVTYLATQLQQKTDRKSMALYFVIRTFEMAVCICNCWVSRVQSKEFKTQSKAPAENNIKLIFGAL